MLKPMLCALNLLTILAVGGISVVHAAPNKYDNFGRAMTTGDYNGDGRLDLIIGDDVAQIGLKNTAEFYTAGRMPLWQ